METIVSQEDRIIKKIYLIRGAKVMLDRDLAELFGVQPKRLREQVKRNLERFPSHFMFRLTEEETDLMVSQFAIPTKQSLGGSLPLVFTEHGLLMLANVLKSERAIKTSIQIIEIFVKLRQYLMNTVEIRMEIEQIKNTIVSHSKNAEIVFHYLDELNNRIDLIEQHQEQDNRKRIGYNNQDSTSLQ